MSWSIALNHCQTNEQRLQWIKLLRYQLNKHRDRGNSVSVAQHSLLWAALLNEEKKRKETDLLHTKSIAQNEVKFLTILKHKIKQAYILVEKERKEKQDLALKVTDLENQIKSISIKSSIQSSIEKELQNQRKESIKVKCFEISTQTELSPSLQELNSEQPWNSESAAAKIQESRLGRQCDKRFEITQNSIEIVDDHKIITNNDTIKRSSSIDKLEKIRRNK